jgi:hypothetical protein
MDSATETNDHDGATFRMQDGALSAPEQCSFSYVLNFLV